jgi:hypothetical protein
LSLLTPFSEIIDGAGDSRINDRVFHREGGNSQS